MTPEDMLRAGVDPRAYYPDFDLAAQARAGNIPAETLGSRGATTIKPGTTGVNPGVLERMRSSVESRLQGLGPMGEEFKTKARAASAGLEKRPLGRMSTLGTAGLMATGQAMQGDIMGALSQGLGGLGGGAAASALVNSIKLPGALGVVARIGAPIIGAMAGGNMLEAITGGLGAKAKETTEPMYFPGTNIPLTKGAAYENIRNRDLDYTLRSNKALGEQERALTRKGMQDQLEMKIQLEKAMLPIQEQISRSNLVNAQAKIASEGAVYQALGRQAGQFQLAGIDRTETGATLRTAISQNPYLGATLSAPSISFG
jgi:hypothetical protein